MKILIEEFEENEPQAVAPLYSAYTNDVLDSLDPRLHEVAISALSTQFHPEPGVSPTLGLNTASFKEQFQRYVSRDSGFIERFRASSIATYLDSIKTQDVNIARDNNLGDAYILRNLESVMAFARDNQLDVLLGRYSGDECLAIFVPQDPDHQLDPVWLDQQLTSYNRQFIDQNHPTNNKLREVLPIIRANQHNPTLELGIINKSVRLADIQHATYHHEREHQLLGSIIDATHDQSLGNSSLFDSLLHSLQSRREINSEEEIRLLTSRLPASRAAMYNQLLESGISSPMAAAYVEAATFDELMPRAAVYRMEVFQELADALATYYENTGGVVIASFGDPHIKTANLSSHALGDLRLIAGFEQVLAACPEMFIFKHNGSGLAIYPVNQLEDIQERFSSLIDTNSPPNLGTYDGITTPLIIGTIYQPDGQPAFITTDNRSELWNIVDGFRFTQSYAETSYLLTLCQIHAGWDTILTTRLSLRRNRLQLAYDLLESSNFESETQLRIQRALDQLSNSNLE